MNALNTQKIAILSIEPFRFGVETAQIQEIQTFTANRIVRQFDNGSMLIRANFSQAMLLPVFDFRQGIGLSITPHNLPSRPLTCLIFRWQEQFAGCLIEKVEHIISVQFSALHPVPHILTHIARACHIWGFYVYIDQLVPLFDLARITSTPVILDTLHRCVSSTTDFGPVHE